jgi:hypothetical protein
MALKKNSSLPLSLDDQCLTKSDVMSLLYAPRHVPNTVIRRDRQTPTVKEEIRHYGSHCSARLSVHQNISEERSASIIRVTRISEQGTTVAVTSNRRTLQTNTIVFVRSVRRLLVAANAVPSSQILTQILTLMMEVLRSSETSVLTRAIRRNSPEGGILHSHRRENHKTCKFLHKNKLHGP